MALVYKSNLVSLLREEMKREGMNPDSFTFRFDGVTLSFKNIIYTDPRPKFKQEIIDKKPRYTVGRLLTLVSEKRITAPQLALILKCSTQKIYTILNKKVAPKKDELRILIDYSENLNSIIKQSTKGGGGNPNLHQHREKFLQKTYGNPVSQQQIQELKEMVESSGIALSQIALQSNVAPSLLYKWLNGKTVPRETTYNRAMEFLTKPHNA